MDLATALTDLEAAESVSTDSGIAGSVSQSDDPESVSSRETITTDSGVSESTCSSRSLGVSSSISGSSESLQTLIGETDSEIEREDTHINVEHPDGASIQRSVDPSVSEQKVKSWIGESFGYMQQALESTSTDSGNPGSISEPDEVESVSSRDTITTDFSVDGCSTCCNGSLRVSSSIFGSSESLQTVIEETDYEIESKKIDITVERPDGTSFQMSVDPSASVQEIKSRIGDRHGYMQDQQALYHKGQLLKDGRLRHHGVAQGSTLNLKLHAADVFVSDFQGKTHTIRVEPNCTVATLKRRIASRTGVPERQQRLEYRGKILEQGDATLNQYKIPANASLQLQGRLRGG